MDHPSLTSINFGNQVNSKNKNKLGNIGFDSLLDGILQSKYKPLLSMINLAGNCITRIDKLGEVLNT